MSVGRWQERLTFLAGSYAGIFDPNRGVASMIARDPDGDPFSCVLAGDTGRMVVTRNVSGRVAVWRDGALVASWAREGLATKNAVQELCSTGVLFESSIRARFDPDETRVLVLAADDRGCGRELRLFEVGLPERKIPLPDGCITELAFTPMRKRIELSQPDDAGSFVYDIDEKRIAFKTTGSATWRPDGARFVVVSGSDGVAKTVLFESSGGKPLRSFPNRVLTKWSPSGKLLFGRVAPPAAFGLKAKVGVVDAETGAIRGAWEISPLGCGEELVWGEGDRLAYAEGTQLTFWSPGQRPTIRQQSCDEGVPMVDLSRDGKRILAFDGIFDFESGKRLTTLKGDFSGARNFSPDGAYVFGWHEEVDLVWSSATGEVVSVLQEEGPHFFDFGDWASGRSVLWSHPEKGPWIGLHDPALRRTLRIGVGLVGERLGVVAIDEAGCYDGPRELVEKLLPDFASHRHCPGLLGGVPSP